MGKKINWNKRNGKVNKFGIRGMRKYIYWNKRNGKENKLE